MSDIETTEVTKTVRVTLDEYWVVPGTSNYPDEMFIHSAIMMTAGAHDRDMTIGKIRIVSSKVIEEEVEE